MAKKKSGTQQEAKACTPDSAGVFGTNQAGRRHQISRTESAKVLDRGRACAAIRKQVNSNVDWEKAKLRVLPTARKMGKVAAALTGPKFRIIPPWAAKAASEAVKHDPKCPPTPGQGRGGFCP